MKYFHHCLLSYKSTCYLLSSSLVFLCVLLGMYFFTIVQSLVDWGYTRGDDVRGAPYDWRKAPSKETSTQATKTNLQYPLRYPLSLQLG